MPDRGGRCGRVGVGSGSVPDLKATADGSAPWQSGASEVARLFTGYHPAMARSSGTSDWLLFGLLGANLGKQLPFIKIAVGYEGPLELVSFRLMFAALTLAVIVRLSREPLPRDRRTIADPPAAAVVNVVVPFS